MNFTSGVAFGAVKARRLWASLRMAVRAAAGILVMGSISRVACFLVGLGDFQRATTRPSWRVAPRLRVSWRVRRVRSSVEIQRVRSAWERRRLSYSGRKRMGTSVSSSGRVTPGRS
jgi:hypothetical protein